MKLVPVAICLAMLAPGAMAQSTESAEICQQIANRTNSKAPIRSNPSVVLQEVRCNQTNGATEITYRYVFEEINNQAADNRAGKRIGRQVQKLFCDEDEKAHEVLKLLNVRVTLENATGGPMGSHAFGLSDC